jgi:DNA primase
MAGKIPKHFIQDLLARVDLVDLIDARLPLKRSGSNYVARCPFHNEKSPSFSVSRDKQFYHCFGCGANGNAIGFLMEYDRLSFREAVETLADSAGLPIPVEASSPSAERAQPIPDLYEVQERACDFYQTQLKSHTSASRAVEYLKQRGVSGEIALRYRLGYAPPGYRNLPSDFSIDLLKAAGLVTAKDGGGAYDCFRDRVVFPIRDRRGRVVGFGGRVLGDGMPKYLNSPETATFKKSREVYGLYELLNEVRKPEFILVVEGYMDVIALAQFGVPNAVATLGTATSADHVSLLFRFTNDLVFCFDGDTAGRSAAWKALEASLPHLREGKQLKFLELPEQHDPDSLVREEGTESFLARVRGAQPFMHYFFKQLTQGINLSVMEGNADDQRILGELARPLIDRMPLGALRDMTERRLRELAPSYKPGDSAKLVEAQSRPSAKHGGKPSPLRLFVALLLQNPSLAATITRESRQSLIKDEKAGALIERILGFLEESPGLTSGGMLELFRGSPEESLVAKMIGLDTMVPPDKVPVVFSDTLTWLEGRLKAERISALIHKSASGALTSEELEELRTMRR